MALVWRMETPEGHGMYAAGAGPEGGLEEGRPCPWDDYGLAGSWERMTVAERSHYLFGFRNLNQLKHWLDEPRFFDLCHSKKVGAYCYKVPDDAVIHGYHQTVFRRDKAELVGAVDALTLGSIVAS